MHNFAKPLRALLTQAGCYFLRDSKGSHETWFSPLTQKNITVPSSIKNRHTANGILKDAGLQKAF